MTNERETSVIMAARAGHQRAQDELVAAYLPLVYNIVGRALNGHADTDDVVQETMLRALGGLDGLRDPAHFRSWLVAIAMNQVRGHWRDRAAEAIPAGAIPGTADPLDAVDPGADFVDLTIVRLELSGQRRETAEATRWLDEGDRELLSLWWLESTGELTRAEVAEALELTPQHAAVRVQRMKAQLEAARIVVRALAAVPRCEQLERTANLWDGRPSPLWRKRFARHTRDCPLCGGGWAALVPAEGLLVGLGLVPVVAGLLGAADPATTVVGHGVADSPAEATGSTPVVTTAAGTSRVQARLDRARRRRRTGACTAAVAVLVAGGGAYLFLDGPDPRDEASASAVAASTPTPSAPSASASAEPSPSKASPSPSSSPSRSASPKAKPSASSAKPSPRPSRTQAPPAPKPPAPKPPAPKPPVQGGFEEQVVALVNTERGKAGCAPVTSNSALARAAADHSADMAARDYFSHSSPDGTDPGDRITAAGYRWSTYGENIARGQQSPASVMEGWMNSPGHRANILNCGFKELGVGVHQAQGGPWWTQAFGTKL
ncbi:sigma-70 family RNA polymerase sigma factor [Streptomyces sp. NPDC060194]|uniref:sigma-70 family RNA polymerase sigma factor n=1 Tax=Streptomyces sp. NPDC060194 TaxID=3347069 RepID=UPI003659C2B3